MQITDHMALTAAGFRLGAIIRMTVRPYAVVPMPGAWKMLHIALLEAERSVVQQDKAGAKSVGRSCR